MFEKTVARVRLAQKDDEQGFTLIELMVVVLIIAILIAIAIPTFLGARTRAQDRAAQSSLRIALTAAKTSFTDTSDYAGSFGGVVGPPATGLTAIEPSLTFTTGASTGFKVVSVETPGAAATTWWAEVLSKSGTCFGIEDKSGAGGGTFYAGGASPAPAAGCTAPAAGADPDWTGAGW
jgi:type IV pilus assembly protein PilA